MPEVSVILTFHDEGLVVHKTFLALRRMLKKLDDNRISYEVISHIDNGDKVTTDYIEGIADEWGMKVLKNSFGEPSSSRNYAIREARGKYVCLMDGDDIFSEDWLVDAYHMQESLGEEAILHPEYNITFGVNEQPRIWKMSNSFDIDTDLLILFGRNRWCAGTFLKREVGVRVPYEAATGCYGFEDWWYNCETRCLGIKHLVVPGSVIFYRVRKDSVYAKHVRDDITIPYTQAFSLENMKKMYKRSFEGEARRVMATNKTLEVLRIGHKVVRHLPLLKKSDKKITDLVTKRRGEKMRDSLPDSVYQAWKAANAVDGELYPDLEVLARMPEYDSERDYLGKAFCRVVHEISGEPDYVFMMPSMNIGGTEKVLENYLRAIYDLHPKWKVVVIGKLPDGHPYKIPPNVNFVDFRGITFGLCDWDKEFLFTRFVVQLHVRRLHIVNDEFYYRWAINNKLLLAQIGVLLNVSFFMHEFTVDEKRIQSFADSYLVELAPYINKIFTDNNAIVDNLVNRTGFPRNKFSVHYQPVELEMNNTKGTVGGDSIHKILWAGRVAPQKRPDILKKIAARLPSNYTVEVYGRIQKPYFKDDYFRGAKNIKYKGTFSNVANLPVEDYDVFLYTSQTDGIPNILLEMAALGLPIVATREGGVPDFVVDGQNGRLVDLNNIDEYVDAIVDVIEKGLRKKYVKNAQKLLKERHSWQKYIETIKKDI